MVTITSAALGRKRTRAVARAWPALARGLGADFARLFTAYARAETPPDAGALADGLAFSRTLAREQHLPDSALIERMLATTRLKLRRNRLATFRSSGRFRDTSAGEAAGQDGAGWSLRLDDLVTRFSVFQLSGCGFAAMIW